MLAKNPQAEESVIFFEVTTRRVREAILGRYPHLLPSKRACLFGATPDQACSYLLDKIEAIRDFDIGNPERALEASQLIGEAKALLSMFQLVHPCLFDEWLSADRSACFDRERGSSASWE